MPLQPSAVIRLKDGNYFSLTPTMDMLLRAQMAVIRRIGATRIAALIGVEPACSEVSITIWFGIIYRSIYQ